VTTVASLMDALEKAIDDTASRIERVHGAQWDARADVARNLVELGPRSSQAQ
jgi:hypothetical protein